MAFVSTTCTIQCNTINVIKYMCTDVLFQFYLEQIHGKTAPQVYRIDNEYVKPFIFRMHVHHKDPDTVLQFKKTYISQKKLKLSVKSAFR